MASQCRPRMAVIPQDYPHFRIKIRTGSHHGFLSDFRMPTWAQENFHGEPMVARDARKCRFWGRMPQEVFPQEFIRTREPPKKFSGNSMGFERRLGMFLKFHGFPMPATDGRNSPGLPTFSHQDPNGFPSWIFVRFPDAHLGARKSPWGTYGGQGCPEMQVLGNLFCSSKGAHEARMPEHIRTYSGCPLGRKKISMGNLWWPGMPGNAGFGGECPKRSSPKNLYAQGNPPKNSLETPWVSNAGWGCS